MLPRLAPGHELGKQHDLADVAPLGEHVLRSPRLLEAERARDHGVDGAVVEQLAQRLDPRFERLTVTSTG